MNLKEEAICFRCGDNQLIGILHYPHTYERIDTAVLIIVGGPQTRVGSHRQFVLLARELARHGVPCMRFDYQGMGDSSGEQVDFLNITQDIDSAVQQCLSKFAAKQVVFWGLCDAASSALIFSKNKPSTKISGMVLLNPWVRTEQGEAATIVKHYYLKRLVDLTFWRKVFRLKFDFHNAISNLLENLKRMHTPTKQSQSNTEATSKLSNEQNYVSHMLQGLQQFSGNILLITSGNDLTAAEFLDLVSTSKPWQQAINSKVNEQHHIAGATHTFSSARWRAEVAEITLKWLKKKSKLETQIN